jgi:hypothetical protein
MALTHADDLGNLKVLESGKTWRSFISEQIHGESDASQREAQQQQQPESESDHRGLGTRVLDYISGEQPSASETTNVNAEPEAAVAEPSAAPVVSGTYIEGDIGPDASRGAKARKSSKTRQRKASGPPKMLGPGPTSAPAPSSSAGPSSAPAAAAPQAGYSRADRKALDDLVDRIDEPPASSERSAAPIREPRNSATQHGRPGSLSLGENEVYREALLVAQQRTGIDAAALAAMIDAEAAKKGGKWNPKSAAGTSSALGLTQFLNDSWDAMALNPKTLLHETALARGYVQRNAGGDSFKIVQRDALRALRTDPLLSIVTAAEYGTQNLAAMARDGVVPDGITDDERAHMMYIGHHEGSAGAVIHYTDSATCTEEQAETALENFAAGRALRKQRSSAREAYREFAASFCHSKFPSQVSPNEKGRAIIQKYLDANGGSWEHAYRAWLREYADRKIQPDGFRESA